ncbi:MAG: glucuronate isomerase [Pseudomonadota bacterium]
MATPVLALDTGATELYETVADLPIVSPHGHCDPHWFAEDVAFSDPSALLVTPDHYVFRLLYSHGVSLGALGIGPGAECDPRTVFRRFASHWHHFLGTPSGLWIGHTLRTQFGYDGALNEQTADAVYDRIDAALQTPAYRPRALIEQMGVRVLATTDGALDDLAGHARVAAETRGWRLVPTFRPDSVVNPEHPRFDADLAALESQTECTITDMRSWCDALRARRAHFVAHGATATDHDVPHLHTQWLAEDEANRLFSRVRSGQASRAEQRGLYGHMLVELALMSRDDGLVMQLHVGSSRSTNRALAEAHGPDMGADIPHRADWVGGLDALLNVVGNDPAMRLIAFTLDESAYARELAPMAGHWPALRLGPPWWFHDSPNGIARFFDQVVETAGYGNLAGFNDDTRAFLSIPARHDLWRRCVANHLARHVARGFFGRTDAEVLARRLSVDLAVDAYRLGPAMQAIDAERAA